jgi:hypothetical protein
MKNMRRFMKSLTGIAILTSAMGLSSAAHAAYFIRPYVQLGQGVIDGYVANGPTSGSQNFTSDISASVDLETATVRNYLKVTGPSSGGSGFGQSASVFGDRLKFNGPLGSNVDFSFGFDGRITVPARPNPNSTQQVGVFATLFVHDASTGATYQNFNVIGGERIGKTVFLDFRNPTEDVDQLIAETLSGSFLLDGNTSYDVFASLSIFASLNDNPVTAELDFLHTGTFGIQADPGVTFTSDSGVFLGSGLTPGGVPEPANWALMIMGFGLVGSAVRRRKNGARFALA